MPQFHKPRLSSAIVCALFCINYSFASPLVIAANPRPVPSILAAYEPVHILDPEDLPAEWVALKDNANNAGTTSITDDGTTQLTTYKNPRDLARERDREEATASEPVNIIPVDRLSPDLRSGGGINSVTNDGTTQTTTFNVPRSLTRKRRTPPPVQSASAPVNLLPGDRFRGPGGGISGVTNDGTTLTTTFNTNQRKTNQTTSSLDLVRTTTTNITAANPNPNELTMGLNCEGSAIMCVGATQYGVMHTLRDYMYAIPQGYRYYAGQNIACMKHHVYPNPWITWGYYCAFMQGNVSSEGEDGTEILLKMQQMIEHHCMGCGSVPFSPDNDPMKLGILTVNYVRQSECEGLCYYVPPGQSAESVKVPQGMVLVQ